MSHPVKFMIVEDEAMYATLLKIEILAQGWEICSICSSGEEAVQQADHHQPDVILMDIGLAGKMNGIQTAEKILSSGSPHIVFMTGYGTPEVEAAARKLNPLAFFEKPVVFSELKEKLNFPHS